jgi:hypothetical protein
MFRLHCRAASAVAALLLAQVPCLAQPTLPPAPQPAPDSQAAPEPRTVPVFHDPNTVLPPPPPGVGAVDGPAPPTGSYAPPWYDRIWDSLAEAPPRRSGDQLHTPLAPSYRVTWMPSEDVIGQNTHLSVVRQDFRLLVPVWKDECSMLGLTTTVRNVINETDAILPDTHQAFPSTLWDVRFGLDYKHVFANGWTAGAAVSFGSASDKPFHTIDEMTASVSAFLRIPSGEHNAWIFSLMYSPTGEVPYPLPGIAYYWQPSDSFNAMIGVPFKLQWRPTEDWLLEASYVPILTVKAKVTYHVWGGVFLYASYDMGNESYFLADRQDVHDRFTYHDQRVTSGLKLDFGRHFLVDLYGGYAFDRYYFEGHSYSDTHQNRVDIGDGPFLGLMLEWRF